MENILVPVSRWNAAKVVYQQGAQLASQFDSTVHLLHVATSEVAADEKTLEEVHQDLRMQRKRLARQEEVTAELHVMRSDDVADAILREAKRLDVGMIVLGTRKPGLVYNAPLGDVVEEVLRDATCLVTVVPTRLVKKVQGKL